jgi:hypothetical protein
MDAARRRMISFGVRLPQSARGRTGRKGGHGMSKQHLRGYVLAAALGALGGGIGTLVVPRLVDRISQCSS